MQRNYCVCDKEVTENTEEKTATATNMQNGAIVFEWLNYCDSFALSKLMSITEDDSVTAIAQNVLVVGLFFASFAFAHNS